MTESSTNEFEHLLGALQAIEIRLRALPDYERVRIIKLAENIVGPPREQEDKSHVLAILSLMAREARAPRTRSSNV